MLGYLRLGFGEYLSPYLYQIHRSPLSALRLNSFSNLKLRYKLRSSRFRVYEARLVPQLLQSECTVLLLSLPQSLVPSWGEALCSRLIKLVDDTSLAASRYQHSVPHPTPNSTLNTRIQYSIIAMDCAYLFAPYAPCSHPKRLADSAKLKAYFKDKCRWESTLAGQMYTVKFIGSCPPLTSHIRRHVLTSLLTVGGVTYGEGQDQTEAAAKELASAAALIDPFIKKEMATNTKP